jgi:hypothetical protein
MASTTNFLIPTVKTVKSHKELPMQKFRQGVPVATSNIREQPTTIDVTKYPTLNQSKTTEMFSIPRLPPQFVERGHCAHQTTSSYDLTVWHSL